MLQGIAIPNPSPGIFIFLSCPMGRLIWVLRTTSTLGRAVWLLHRVLLTEPASAPPPVLNPGVFPHPQGRSRMTETRDRGGRQSTSSALSQACDSGSDRSHQQRGKRKEMGCDGQGGRLLPATGLLQVRPGLESAGKNLSLHTLSWTFCTGGVLPL